jgi:hypothetical protein
MSTRLGLTIVLALATATFAANQNRQVRLFILSGQSNMARLDPNASFTPAVKKAYPDDDVIVVKSAQGGQPIRRWYRGWKAPDDVTKKMQKGEVGDLYDEMMNKVKSGLAGKRPDTIAFVWMQGEADTKRGPADQYEANLHGLIKQLRDDLKRPDVVVVIGRLTDFKKGEADWDKIRAAQEKVAKEDPRAAWIDTDDINGPKKALHHSQAGYAVLGRRFAEKSIELLAKKSDR